MILSCKDIKMEFGANTVLENVSFVLDEGEKAALVGVNGAGKTTLLKILTGEYAASGGEAVLKKDAKIGYLAQMKDLEPENTVGEEFLTVFSELIRAEESMRDMEKAMSGLNGSVLDAMLAKYAAAQHFFEANGGFEYQSRLRGVISGLEFSEAEVKLKTKRLSGGQKTRVSLGKLLLSSPELLLLDEPTNHLDIRLVSWLEDVFLANYRGSVIIVSHDRYFIDKTVTKIIEIEHGKSTVYNGNYSFFAYEKERVREIDLKHYLEQQKEIRKQEETIRLLRSFNREKSIRRAESREKMLNRLERLEKPENAPEKMRIVLEPKLQSGFDVLHVENLGKSFGEHRLFENVSFDIKREEIAALIGPNGIGKTTLFKALLNQLPRNGGNIRVGSNVQIGYYDQEHAALDESKTIFAELSDAYPNIRDGQIRNVLASFVFFGDDVFKEISLLSGGEKGRVALAKLMLGGYNFLMLDEPTNHLDMFSKEILEEALRNYAGTVLYISHDRYFINNTADKIIELHKDGADTYDGDYEYYLRKKAERERERAETDPGEPTASKEDWARKKELQAETRRRQTRLARLESEIEETEERIAAHDRSLQLEEVFSDHMASREVYNKKLELEARLGALYGEWETLQDV